LGGFCHNGIDDLDRDPGCAPGPGCILQKAFDTVLNKPATPQRHHACADTVPLTDLFVLHPFDSQ